MSLRSQEVVFASGVGGGVGDCGSESDLGAQSKNRLVGRAAVQSKQVSIVSFLQRPRGCLLPSASEPPTYAAGLGPTGDAGSFRELDSAEPSVGGLQSQRGGPLRGRPLAGTVEGDPAGPAGGLRCGTVVGLAGEGGGVGYVGSGERGEPHDGQSPKRLGCLPSKRKSPPGASFLIRQDETACKLAAVRRGKRAGMGEPCGGGASVGNVGSGEVRPDHQHHAVNSIPEGAGSGGAHPSEGAPGTGSSSSGSVWGSPDRRGGSDGSVHPPGRVQREGSSSWKGSSGCEDPPSGVQNGKDRRPSGVALRTGGSRGKWDPPDRRGGCGAGEHSPGGERKRGAPPWTTA